MGSLSIWHWLIVLVVVLILFGGRGKIPELMGDFAKGIKNFKKGMADDDAGDAAPRPVNRIEGQAVPDPSVSTTKEEQKQG